MSSKRLPPASQKGNVLEYVGKSWRKARKGKATKTPALGSYWDLIAAGELVDKHLFVKMTSGKTKTKKLTLTLKGQPLPNRPTSIVDGIKDGGRASRIIYLNYIPMEYLERKYWEVIGDDTAKARQKFSNVDTAMEELAEYAVDLGDHPEGRLHLPVRIAGNAANIQQLLQDIGLDFTRLRAHLDDVPLVKIEGYNDTNVEILDRYAYHGDVTLTGSVVGRKLETVDISANVTSTAPYVSRDHPYAFEYSNELKIKQQESRVFQILDEKNQVISLTYFAEAASTLTKETFDEVEQRKFTVTGTEVSVGGAKDAQFATKLKQALEKIDSNKVTDDDGNEVTKDVVKVTLVKGNLVLKTQGREGVEKDSAGRYAFVSAFTFTSNQRTVDVNNDEIIIPVYEQITVKDKDPGAKKKTKKIDKKDYNPENVLRAFLDALSGSIQDEERTVIEINRDFKSTLAIKRQERAEKEKEEEQVAPKRRRLRQDVDEGESREEVPVSSVAGQRVERGSESEEQ